MNTIETQDLGIKFPLWKRQARKLLTAFTGGGKLGATSQPYWALRNINLTIQQGETVGIVGPNGAGKSTLLRAIAGIYSADEGSVHLNGPISTLFTTGLGFNPDLAAADNIRLSRALTHHTKTSDSIVEEILDFADIPSEFTDQPIRSYSTGMHTRLAFATAIYQPHNTLLIDEVLGAGDSRFRLKCQQILESLLKTHTIIIVTHSLGYISKNCRRCIWLDKGSIIMDGTPEEVITAYNGTSDFGDIQGIEDTPMEPTPSGGGDLII